MRRRCKNKLLNNRYVSRLSSEPVQALTDPFKAAQGHTFTSSIVTSFDLSSESSMCFFFPFIIFKPPAQFRHLPTPPLPPILQPLIGSASFAVESGAKSRMEHASRLIETSRNVRSPTRLRALLPALSRCSQLTFSLDGICPQQRFFFLELSVWAGDTVQQGRLGKDACQCGQRNEKVQETKSLA